jgi:hypothetical protein
LDRKTYENMVDNCSTTATDPVLPRRTAVRLSFEIGLSQHGADLAVHSYFLPGIMGNDRLCFSDWQDLRFYHASDLFH